MRIAVGFLAVMASWILLAQSSSAQFEGAVWDTLTADTLRDGLTPQALACTQYQLHLAFAKARPQGGWDIHYRFLDMQAGWAPDRVVESSRPCFRPVIAARWVNGPRMVIVWEADNDIYGAAFDDPFGQFDIINVSNSSDDDMSPSVAIDEAGFIHGAWIKHIGDEYKIAYCVDNTDSMFIDIIEDSYLGEFGGGAQPLIVIEGLTPHIFYRGINDIGYHIHHAYPNWPDTTWTVEFLGTGNSDDYTASAVVDTSGDIHLAISGNEGWGMPGHIYYMRRNHQSGEWSPLQLVSGNNSVADGSLGLTQDGSVYIASCGVSGNFYTGEIFLSDNSQGSFQTRLLRTYQDGTQPVLTFMSGQYGAIALQAIIGGLETRNFEIIYYGPAPSSAEDLNPLPQSPVICYNYPNPFNSSTVIMVQGRIRPDAGMDIYDLAGRQVRTISAREGSRHVHYFIWNGESDNGAICPSGVYFYRLGASNVTGRMVMMK
jgi:hypothetical protein